MKDLLIGAIDLYDWSNVKVWAKSIRESGFTGDVALLTYRVKNQPELYDRCKELNIDLYDATYDSFGRQIDHNAGGRDTQCHQLRFFHAWELLKEFPLYRYVIMTDVKDVWFQQNPFRWLEKSYDGRVVASSENISYKYESWGYDNLLQGFGRIISNIAVEKEWEIYNVGVLGGKADEMKRLFLSIYNITYGRYIPSDQSAFNVIVHETSPSMFFKTTHSVNWACQCGTTLDPTKQQYSYYWTSAPPQIYNNSVITPSGLEYAIVHQWDRVPVLKNYLENKY